MRLEVIVPARIVLDLRVAKIVAEAPNGYFGILPNHGDFVSELVPGILAFTTDEGSERFVAIHAGSLVKCDHHVSVAVQNAIQGNDLSWLRERVERDFRRQDEDERAARAALARLEAGMIRRFRDLESLGP